METDSSALRLFHLFDDGDGDDIAAILAAYAAKIEAPSSTRGSSLGRLPNIDLGAAEAHERLIRDYFAYVPIYSDRTFRRRFRMRRELYFRVVAAVESNDSYFQQRPGATGKIGLSALQKCMTAIRQLVYGMPADAVDEYIRIGESTAIKSLKRFCAAVIAVFGDQYLRAPTKNDVRQLMAMHEKRGFIGMLGSLDCMHWSWKNCPTAWAGQYNGKEDSPTIVLEAVASQDLWFWHVFFGMPGSHNDINVLDRSNLFSSLANMQAPLCRYDINGNTYDFGYFLTDGIYPQWATLVQTIRAPKDRKERHFSMNQEAARKDVERAFGVLQSRFAIVNGPARFWTQNDLGDIMKTCVILHNMIVEDERGDDLPFDYDRAPTFQPSREVTPDFAEFMDRYRAIRCTQRHTALRNDLVKHLWEIKGSSSD